MRMLVNIDVPRLDEAIRFYTEAFDLRLGRRFGDGAIELLGAECPLYLLAKPSGSRATPTETAQRTYARHWTPVHLDVVVDSLEPAVSRAMAAGALLEVPLEEHSWGRIAMLSDPFGHGICLLEFSERGYDAITIG